LDSHGRSGMTKDTQASFTSPRHDRENTSHSPGREVCLSGPLPFASRIRLFNAHAQRSWDGVHIAQRNLSFRAQRSGVEKSLTRSGHRITDSIVIDSSTSLGMTRNTRAQFFNSRRHHTKRLVIHPTTQSLQIAPLPFALEDSLLQRAWTRRTPAAFPLAYCDSEIARFALSFCERFPQSFPR
jgi:hypothetical protein